MLRTNRRLRPSLRSLTLTALTGAALAVPTVATAAVHPLGTAADPGGPCADPDGVSVVVDSTELGGDVVVGCAPSPASGTEALAQAGFAEARDPSGFICAVGGLPDPCPTEFTGSYWSYWSAAADGEWVSYAEGSDTSDPAAGSVEGWRYGDGSVPPEAAPADVAPGTGTDAAAASGTVDEPAAPTADQVAAPSDDDDTSLLAGIDEQWRPALAVVTGLALLAALVVVVVRVRRAARERDED